MICKNTFFTMVIAGLSLFSVGGHANTGTLSDSFPKQMQNFESDLSDPIFSFLVADERCLPFSMGYDDDDYGRDDDE